MILIVSDLHLGKNPNTDESSLAALMSCIQSLGPELNQVVFLGDVFDAFVEYPRKVPVPVSLWTFFAHELQEKGIEVSYFAGNHDRWHTYHIEKALKIPVLRRPEVVRWKGRDVWLEHGDCVGPHSRLESFLRTISDQPWALSLYRTGLPFGLGQRLAETVSRRFSDFEPSMGTVDALLAHASAIVRENRGSIVIMGHCHLASLVALDHGLYINTGDWYGARTFVTLEDNARLCAWKENGVEVIQEEGLPAPRVGLNE